MRCVVVINATVISIVVVITFAIIAILVVIIVVVIGVNVIIVVVIIIVVSVCLSAPERGIAGRGTSELQERQLADGHRRERSCSFPL